MKQRAARQIAVREVESMRDIYLVFTRTNTILSRLIHLTKRSRYTHAALALDEDLNQMFSFGRKTPRNPFVGVFRKEALHEGVYALHRQLPGMVLRLSVTAGQYETIRGLVAEFILYQEHYGYNYKVLFRNLFGSKMRGVSCRRYGGENRFVCSEFVYYVLEQSNVCSWQVRRESVMPRHLMQLDGEIVYEGDLKKYSHKGPQQELILTPAMMAI